MGLKRGESGLGHNTLGGFGASWGWESRLGRVATQAGWNWGLGWHTSSAESSQMPVAVHASAVQVPATVAQALALVAEESEQVPHSFSVAAPDAQVPTASQSSLNVRAAWGLAHEPDMPGPYKMQSGWVPRWVA